MSIKQQGSIFIAIVIFAILGTLLEAFVIKTFWSWFVLSIFPNLPLLTLAESLGLAFFVHLFVTDTSKPDYKDVETVWGIVMVTGIHAFVKPVLMLVLGYIVHSFIV